jgi:hypothetical protein
MFACRTYGAPPGMGYTGYKHAVPLRGRRPTALRGNVTKIQISNSTSEVVPLRFLCVLRIFAPYTDSATLAFII